MAKVKICGLRTTADAQAANACQPDYTGFVFAPGRRQVSREQAAAVRAALDPAIMTVGVFVNQPVAQVASLCEAGIIGMVQLHGGEDDAYLAQLRSLTDAPVIRAVPVGSSRPSLPGGADFLLFDTLSAARGGSGECFDWALLEGYAGPPWFLAGGLEPGNVREALRRLSPDVVDVSSGVETDGVKDPEKMWAFVNTVREMSV